MTIQNVSGNIQPNTGDSGKVLPSSNGGGPSTSDINTTNNVESVPNRLRVVTGNNTAEKQQSKESVEQAKSEIEELQAFNQQINRSLQFRIDDELGITVVRVIDKATDELIRQFPPEELINLSRKLKDLNDEGSPASGVLLQEKV